MSLDSLRKLRAQTEEALIMELAQVTQELSRMERHYRDLEAQVQSDAMDFSRHSAQGLTIEDVLEWQGLMDSRQAALKQARRALDDLTEVWHRTRARVVEASQDRRVLDRLAERRREARRADVRHREQLATDEAAARRRCSDGGTRVS